MTEDAWMSHRKKITKEKVKILITGATCSLNIGAAAILVSSVKALESFYKETQVTVQSIYRDIDSERFRNKLLPGYKIVVTGFRYRKKIPYVISALLLPLKCIHDYVQADIVIDLRGGGIADGYSSAFNNLMQSYQLLPAVILKKPIVIYGQSLGPFRTEIDRFLAKCIFNNTSLITVREKISWDCLSNLGVNIPSFLTADPAFLLEPSPTQKIDPMLKRAGINKGNGPLIGVAPSYWYLNTVPGYIELFARIVDFVIEEYDAKVLFVPHVVDPKCDDRVAANRISQLIEHKDKIGFIEGDYTPENLKGVIGYCDLFIGSRMHTIIAATSMQVPSIAIATGHRTRGIMKMLNQEKFALNPRACARLGFSTLVFTIDSCWSNRKSIRKELGRRITQIKKLALLNAKLTSVLLKQQSGSDCPN